MIILKNLLYHLETFSITRSNQNEILVLLLSVVISNLTWADHHSESGPLYAFYHLQVGNPAALVSAMDTFWASDCGKQYPADVALSQELFNGSYLSLIHI